ncbi:hypothetical protein AGMMS49525_06780 [Bacteroidia bacterium]|nr:hypothetical protein AGMMS49525_06780 [Bacteroidia bacterium]
MIDKCKQAGLKEPEFVEEESFTVTLWRNQSAKDTDTPQVNPQVPPKYPTSTQQVPNKYPSSTHQVEPSEEIKRLVMVMSDELKRVEIQNILKLQDSVNFRVNYLTPAIEQNYIELVYPNNPNHPQQKYRLTQKGIVLKNKLLCQ